MHEVPDYEEIYGIDPNDAKNFEPKKAKPQVFVGPKAKSWMVVGRRGDESDRKLLILKVEDEGYSWLLPTSRDCKITEIATVFDDVREADKAMFAVREHFPELTIWVFPL